ncbi:MAG TPA: hypothetical protein H9723_04165 [Candidatus Mediterraneibacter stercoravium]|uniref:Uncharacterized protein n=1 Tax=Candidatus Mediterraneibacter stercoravium TaxID=2838685 RepID=A0A9D2K1K7_9FIRM|nr:hypothetical protein [Candidatus Mediterraneibacter stercoravium]
MSQEKVDKYKKDKANRKKIMRKERAMSIVRKAILTLVALALVGWLGYSAYDIYDSNQERSVAEVNFDSVTEYLNGLSETE